MARPGSMRKMRLLVSQTSCIFPQHKSRGEEGGGIERVTVYPKK